LARPSPVSSDATGGGLFQQRPRISHGPLPVGVNVEHGPQDFALGLGLVFDIDDHPVIQPLEKHRQNIFARLSELFAPEPAEDCFVFSVIADIDRQSAPDLGVVFDELLHGVLGRIILVDRDPVDDDGRAAAGQGFEPEIGADDDGIEEQKRHDVFRRFAHD
jgi:hypothetical protein